LDGPLNALGNCCDHSWVRDLAPDLEAHVYVPNKTSREVKSGHYVLVEPTPLRQPHLVSVSLPMASELGLSESDCKTEQFQRFFSGDIHVARGFVSWATPYALSINGREMTRNCPFGTGNGYGDGRAVSIGEVLTKEGHRWELQLKGGGTTPFCRGGDGRAVLRSSVREFLVSEAMHHLGVPTTRALSLVASQSESVRRPWYNGRDKALVSSEKCAITCRVSPSFLRVGHVELFGRRARSGGELEMKQLEMIVKHLMVREYHKVDSGAPMVQQILALLSEFKERLANLVASWIRVGYCQGNFNSDNCLASGRTMDYGPFGFVEPYEPDWCMWVGGGDHFGFMNQPSAAAKNFASLCSAVRPLLDEVGRNKVKDILSEFDHTMKASLADTFRRKLGLRSFGEEARQLHGELDMLLQECQADYTIFWRQLAWIPDQNLTESTTTETLLKPLHQALYVPLTPEGAEKLASWLRSWLALLGKEGPGGQESAALMRKASPKYVPREWMLIGAYTAAQGCDYSELERLQKLFLSPYEEQPEYEEMYFRRQDSCLTGKGGVSYMT